MASLRYLLSLLSLLFALVELSTCAPSPAPSPTCPLDFSHVLRIPWNTTDCRSYDRSIERKNSCCQSVLTLIGIPLAHRLKQTSNFRLPNLATSVSCVNDLQRKLDSLSLPSTITSTCFDPNQFVINNETCAGIQTTQDWVSRLGPTTTLDSACSSGLTDLTRCDACVAAGFRVQKQLISLDGNSSHGIYCYHFAVLYAAGIVNKKGPESDDALSCLFSLSLRSPLGSKKKRHKVALVSGAAGAVIAALVIAGLIGLYFRFGRAVKGGEAGWEDQESRPKWRPNTGSIWFKIEELEKATNNFSQKNFIGRGGFGFVYKGVLPDGSVIAVKKVIESEFQGDAEFRNEVEIISNLKHRNLVPLRGCSMVDEDGESHRYLVYDYMSNGNLDDHLFPPGKTEEALAQSLVRDEGSGMSNPKGIMERFLQVGILCAHVLVALRPTILDALRMLEGDIEVPPIPDRPVPLAHPSYRIDGNGFTISPALSGLQIHSGDMLR
ncbi:unnamed protein product [Thlaspi arvense]|uniref:Protein kinase domain-containing protein n=1 Tax=Thlaspi arvense TaxID=13288 RepID=A0AAU9RFW8_THLAR|nr:unnamed protein product [Thlaspi arvense]